MKRFHVLAGKLIKSGGVRRHQLTCELQRSLTLTGCTKQKIHGTITEQHFKYNQHHVLGQRWTEWGIYYRTMIKTLIAVYSLIHPPIDGHHIIHLFIFSKELKINSYFIIFQSLRMKESSITKEIIKQLPMHLYLACSPLIFHK